MFFVSCSQPKQTTDPGDCGHIIYTRSNGSWSVTGMYINDSLIIMGNPNAYHFNHPIVNIKTGKVIDEIEYQLQVDRIKGDNNLIQNH